MTSTHSHEMNSHTPPAVSMDDRTFEAALEKVRIAQKHMFLRAIYEHMEIPIPPRIKEPLHDTSKDTTT